MYKYFKIKIELNIFTLTHVLSQGRARQLYNAGYKTLQSIAKADPREIKDKIPYLSKKIVAQITAAAKVSHTGYILTKYFIPLICLYNYKLFIHNYSF